MNETDQSTDQRESQRRGHDYSGVFSCFFSHTGPDTIFSRAELGTRLVSIQHTDLATWKPTQNCETFDPSDTDRRAAAGPAVEHFWFGKGVMSRSISEEEKAVR